MGWELQRRHRVHTPELVMSPHGERGIADHADRGWRCLSGSSYGTLGIRSSRRAFGRSTSSRAWNHLVEEARRRKGPPHGKIPGAVAATVQHVRGVTMDTELEAIYLKALAGHEGAGSAADAVDPPTWPG